MKINRRQLRRYLLKEFRLLNEGIFPFFRDEKYTQFLQALGKLSDMAESGVLRSNDIPELGRGNSEEYVRSIENVLLNTYLAVSRADDSPPDDIESFLTKLVDSAQSALEAYQQMNRTMYGKYDGKIDGQDPNR